MAAAWTKLGAQVVLCWWNLFMAVMYSSGAAT